MYLSESDSQELSVLKFLEWQIEHQNPTISLISELMFNYVLPVYFFKIGVRCNDEDLIDIARFKSEDLFYAFKHPFYSDVSHRDLRNHVVYRPSVWEY